MNSILRSGLAVAALLASQLAAAVPLTFTLDSGSTAFKPTACSRQSDLDLNGNGLRDTLRLCGISYPVSGVISGSWDGTRLTGLDGVIDGSPITGGALGGAFYSIDLKPLWTIVTERWGTFVFESLNGANSITETTLSLLGQNLRAYGVAERCRGQSGTFENNCLTKGIALASDDGRISVSEPAALLLVLAGLAGGALALRRRHGAAGLATT
jgi:hypothetical protein